MLPKIALLALVVIVSSVCCLASYSDCGSEDGFIISVDISKCGTARRCPLKRKTNATMEISFTSNVESQNLTAVVHGIILNVPIPFSLPNSNACINCGIDCPLQPGKTYKYKTTMPILADYPRVTVDIKWEIKDDSGKRVVCALIPAKIA